MSPKNRALALAIVCVVMLIVPLFSVRITLARDIGQWENTDPAIREWYQSLMQPDVPNASCCGEADAYWADEIHVRDGKTFAVITDDRPDEPRGRPHVEIGTEVEIPANKLKWDRRTRPGTASCSSVGAATCFAMYSREGLRWLGPKRMTTSFASSARRSTSAN
jgi:hypothetical protein